MLLTHVFECGGGAEAAAGGAGGGEGGGEARPPASSGAGRSSEPSGEEGEEQGGDGGGGSGGGSSVGSEAAAAAAVLGRGPWRVAAVGDTPVRGLPGHGRAWRLRLKGEAATGRGAVHAARKGLEARCRLLRTRHKAHCRAGCGKAQHGCCRRARPPPYPLAGSSPGPAGAVCGGGQRRGRGRRRRR